MCLAETYEADLSTEFPSVAALKHPAAPPPGIFLGATPFHGVPLRGRIEAGSSYLRCGSGSLGPFGLSTEFPSVAALKRLPDGDYFDASLPFHGVPLRGRIEAVYHQLHSWCDDQLSTEFPSVAALKRPITAVDVAIVPAPFPRSSPPWPH